MEQEVKAGAAPVETQEQFVARRDKEISDWLSAKATLDSAKPIELEAREKVSATLFPEPKKGTNRYHLNGGYSLKLVYGTNYTLGDKDLVVGEGEAAVKVPVKDQVAAILNQISTLGPEAHAIAEKLVQWKPELHEKTYLELDTTNNIQATIKSLIDSILTTKPATPQLTFEVPKEKK